ncbi:HlyD family efflux transporter periplasmic adaptor subunit [Methylobacterium sp. BTF04]|uniref:HlyD family efflux transporter periplasmic adaptor subunit n=1 Tax=Methylobacterium sp. BTF04 TaxID=2708300 RepID=UPI0013D68EDA|nr:HlyD family efflux transporter periplasmic adaptor subunit [Methylobacterium sp. BTF04]NEU11418.1 HlyD family efflux transporter periplasmic adaptor subunit [Methylobacterium sp. BTF04]
MHQTSPLPSVKPSQVSAQAKAQLDQTRIVRLSSYSVATVLALLMTTATLPPLLADQSDRAVINAPIMLLTAPIAGEVTDVLARTGQRLEPGESVLTLQNGRVDRTTLIVLDGKVEELRGSLLAAREKKNSDIAYVAALDVEIAKQVEQTVQRFEGEISEARARVASSDAEGLAKKAVVDRQQAMVNRNIASVDLLRPTIQQYAAARFDKDAETAKLNLKITQLNGVKQGIFVGNEMNSLAILNQKRRDLAFDAQRLAIEEAQLGSSLKSQQALFNAEKRRLDSLSVAQMRAMSGGYVLSVGVAPGRHVNPGDSVATMVDCDNAFVVGIFSYRQAQSLAVGTRVRVSSADGEPRFGAVTEILPKTSDKTDEQYAVPFPQTERREMYVLVGFDSADPSSQPASLRRAGQANSCSVGQWVTITRENGWVPSASVAWKNVASGFGIPSAAWNGVSHVASRAQSGVRILVASLFSTGTATAREQTRNESRRSTQGAS